MLAIYRKYRPAVFDDLLGQENTVRVLREAARQNKLAHSYLLTGPRGTGKTTTARLIAKIANCSDNQKNRTGEPCNVCENCLEINSGRGLDIVEIDAASNRGIDEIRNLRESVRLHPVHLAYKVFIIDEAHMLTKEAFNALLKTLEEPPEKVIIILATTEADKIPPTISSRTQQFHFRRAALGEIAVKLKKIAVEEKIKISPEALELIAASAEGSFRDAESLLDQLITFNDDRSVSVAEVEAVVGKVGFGEIVALAEAALRGDIDEVLRRVSRVSEGGYNLAQFAKDLIQHLRRVAVIHYSPEMKQELGREVLAEHLEQIVKQAQLFQTSHLELIKNLIKAYGEMRYSQFPVIPLEVALIESSKQQ